MRYVQLTKGAMAIVDDEDYGFVSRWSWYLTNQGYAARSTENKGVRLCILMHRAITAAATGVHIDHINGNRLDNRRSNLRECAPWQNQGNRRPHAGRRFKGVIYQAQLAPSVRAEIRIGGKSKHLGVFQTEEEAARAYDRAAKEHFGEFARLNFPDESAA